MSKVATRYNAKHGLRMKVSSLPKGCHFIETNLNQYRRAIEGLVIDRRGEIGLYEAGCIATACDWEKVRQLCSRWIRKAEGSMSNADKLAFAREVARAGENRDKCLERLGLDKAEAPEPPDPRSYIKQLTVER